MPRRELLTPAERESLLTVPVIEAERMRHYTFSRSDLAFIRGRRWNYNRLSVAFQLANSGIPGVIWRAARRRRRRSLRWWRRS